MPGRTRTVSYLPNVGSKVIYGKLTTRSVPAGSDRCVDFVGNHTGVNPLDIDKSHLVGGQMSGQRIDSTGTMTWTNWPCWSSGLIAATFSGYAASSITETQQALRAYNLSNPSRTEMLLPASIVELRDLPKMLRFAGRILLNPDVPKQLIRRVLNWAMKGKNNHHALTHRERRMLKRAGLSMDNQGGLSAVKALSAANLAWQFGWAPIISDIKKMTGFQDAVERRRGEINRLHSGKGLKRRIELENLVHTASGNQLVNSTEATSVSQPWSGVSQRRVWSVIRWKPKNRSALPPNDAELQRAMLGLTSHGLVASAWELLPWSWLIDYFTNVGDIIQSSSNQMDAIAISCNMRMLSKRVTAPTVVRTFSNGSVTVTALDYRDEVKLRKVGLGPPLAAPEATLPILSNKQLSILGSLAMLRSGGR